ncbi:MAG TPA: prolyl oligopeptidase family serine peptidase [Dongiaceae bacterium]
MTSNMFAALAQQWSRYPIIWSPCLSGDGKWLAWSWTGIADTANVWIVPTDGSAPPRQLTNGADHFYARSLSYDGSRIALAQSIGSNEHDRLFIIDRDGKSAAQPLTALQSDHYVFGGCLSTDGSELVYSADFDDQSGKVAEGSLIYRQNVKTRERAAIAIAQSVCSDEPELSPDGKLVLYGRCDLHPSGDQRWVVDIDGSNDREVLNADDRFKTRAHWLGRGHLLLVQAETETHERVGVLDADTGALRWLIDDAKRTLDGIVAGGDGHSAMVLESDQGRLVAKLLNTDDGTERPFIVDGASLLPIAQLPGGDWIAERYNSHKAHDLVRIEPGTMKITNLTHAESHCPPKKFIAAQDFRWKSSDGLPIQGWLYEPTGESRGLVVWVHGGPTWHSEDWVNPIVQFLANAGFTVLDPNYRGSTGFGNVFREAIKIDGWGGHEQDDIRAGIEALIAAGKARRGRIGVAGLSYGGYSSWVAITRFSDLVDGAVPICGMYELGIDYHATEMPHGKAYSIEMMGGTPEEKPERYFNASPANFTDRIKGNLLIVHGLADSNVSPQNTRTACRDLDKAGIKYDLLTYPDEGHGIYKAGNRENLLLRMANFFEQTFKN